MAKSKTINIEGKEITIISGSDDDYISLTDMARSQMQEAIIIKWLSLKSTIEYLGEWESLYNPGFNSTDFDTIKTLFPKGSNSSPHGQLISLVKLSGNYCNEYSR